MKRIFQNSKLEITAFQRYEPKNYSHELNINTNDRLSDISIFDRIEIRDNLMFVEIINNCSNIEKIFHFLPGSNLSELPIELRGISDLEINPDGVLKLTKNDETITFSKPKAFQKIDNRTIKIPVEYSFYEKDNSYWYLFATGEYDRDYELIIDPLISSTYLGSVASEGAEMDIKVNDDGDVFIYSSTTNNTFLVTFDAYDYQYNGGISDLCQVES